MTRVPIRYAVLLLTVSLALGGVLADRVQAGPPTDALKDFFAAVNVVLTDRRTEDEPLGRLRAIRRHVDDVLDVREAAMLALGREWTARTPLEQNEFVALFADLLERAFVWRLAGKAAVSGGVRVSYVGETTDGDTATVDTALAARDGGDFRVQFRMVRRAERWVVRDVVMDGVSTMDNYRAQFQRVVRDTSWADLVAQMRAKVGAPPGETQVATAAPSRPLTVPDPPLRASRARAATATPRALDLPPLPPAPATPDAVAGRAASLDLDRPGADLPHAIARDVAAVVTPGLLVRDAPPPNPPPPTAALPAALPPLPALDVRTAAAGQTSTPRRADATRVLAATTNRVVDAPSPARPPAPLAALPPSTRVEPPAPVAARVTPEPARPAVWIQVGAYRSTEAAGRVAAQVKGEILVVATPASGAPRREPLLRVRVGPFPDRPQATARLHEIRALGYQPFLASD